MRVASVERMAVTIGEIMNRELYATQADALATNVLQDLMGLGVGGCPVIDDDNRPVGVISIRDLFGAREACVGDRMTAPALTMDQGASIRDAARLMAEADLHRIVVVDGGGRAVGIISALDVIRGLLGIPSRHPVTFPHYDVETGMVWTDDHPLDPEHVEAAPDGPGLLLLISGGAGKPETVIGGETADNVRDRLLEYLMTHGRDRGELRFRAAHSEDREECDAALAHLVGDDHGITT
jgi:CBS domain-containing protein